MKTIKIIAVILLVSIKVQAQSDELQQLMLNIEKLTQFKSILSDLKQGYQIYQQGYSTISNLSKGNFNLHNAYLTGLMAVSPSVQNYGRVAEIIGQQSSIVSEYKKNLSRFRQSGTFSVNELNYFNNVYNQLIKQSGQNLDELGNIMTGGKLRMSDDDRLRAIDRIYNSSSDQLQFLRFFNRQGTMLSLQRSKDLHDTKALKQLYGLN
ncbi:TerB family tellurite resistance protein [Mucilaginibacter sp. UYCu711]|uniref:TerB family tellurite resistance protein n=1 Tax=Mucilaginibacter sp. UYCu711 TaxID=3156339 RepID=UPI003D1E668F